ncbi:MAG: DUF2793 domain-containing protein [Sulfitobacter sp.]
MSQTSPLLSLPYIQPAQAQKHVTHNEALRILDAVTQLSVISYTLTAPPSLPASGDRYIVANGATDAWTDQAGNIAVFVDNTWQFFAPGIGWRADVTGSGQEIRFDGTDWVGTAGGTVLQNLPEVGIGTVADATNKLAVSSDATLLNHNGAGHQLKLNKAISTETSSLLFQTGFAGRAEMGTAGTDDFSIKVSADGATFHTGLNIEGNNGAVQFPNGQIFFEDAFVANDTAWSVNIPWSDPSRIMLWLSADVAGQCGLVTVTGALSGAANFAEIFANPPGSLNFLTGTLVGTTGPSGAINLSIDVTGSEPKLYLENRLGADRTFTLSTLGK